jgi:hypothetical protein
MKLSFHLVKAAVRTNLFPGSHACLPDGRQDTNLFKDCIVWTLAVIVHLLRLK